MQRYIFLDLDDTLFQTLHKCPDADDPRLQVRALLSDGTANSYATHKQQWLWQWFEQDFKIIPVTGRDAGEFARVQLPFAEESVIIHGAVILDKQRQIDPQWLARLQAELPDYYEKLLAVWQDVERFAARYPGYKPRLVNEFEVTWYGVIKHSEGREDALRLMLNEVIINHPHLRDRSLYWHLNGNNLAVLPDIIRKEHAVSFLLERYRQQHPELFTFAAGDSHTDAPFMALCDYALIPKDTQLHQRLAG
ncbi:MAG: hydrolase [Methylovulum sp.]|uniref:hydrolase n=1 Tax=Methylovulum sp. TaxID=1916980 RepID=UPI00261D2F23|nr:hydrolase [Methylovulum sp.]MDD2724401.1 hydrolase [Methylovulum sp.]MDD5124014.1 hydrolase [Methylovulum sp.]